MTSGAASAALQRNAATISATRRVIATVLYQFGIAVWRTKRAESRSVKYWEIIAHDLKAAGWSYRYVSALDPEGRTIWIVDAHRDDGKRFVVHADEILSAFVELESAIWRVAHFDVKYLLYTECAS